MRNSEDIKKHSPNEKEKRIKKNWIKQKKDRKPVSKLCLLFEIQSKSMVAKSQKRTAKTNWWKRDWEKKKEKRN
jgi:hypothetical protein